MECAVCAILSGGTGPTGFEENPYDLITLMNMRNLPELSFALIHPQPPTGPSEDGDAAPGRVPSAPPSFQIIPPVALHSYPTHPIFTQIQKRRSTLSALPPNFESVVYEPGAYNSPRKFTGQKGLNSSILDRTCVRVSSLDPHIPGHTHHLAARHIGGHTERRFELSSP